MKEDIMAEQNLQVDTQSQGLNNQAQGAAKAPETADLMIPKWRFDEANKMRQETEAKLASTLKELEQAKAKDDRIAELEKQIKDMQASYDLEKSTAKKKSAVETALKDKTVDLDVVFKLLDMDKVTFNDAGELQGLEEQVKALQESKPYLWNKAKPVAPKSATANTRPEKTFAQKLAEAKAKQLGVTAKAKNYFN